MDKQLYRGVFKERAFKNFTAKLAKKVGMTRYAVAIRFLDNRADNYLIEKVTE
jgi:hypothetical protein